MCDLGVGLLMVFLCKDQQKGVPPVRVRGNCAILHKRQQEKKAHLLCTAKASFIIIPLPFASLRREVHLGEEVLSLEETEQGVVVVSTGGYMTARAAVVTVSLGQGRGGLRGLDGGWMVGGLGGGEGAHGHCVCIKCGCF